MALCCGAAPPNERMVRLGAGQVAPRRSSFLPLALAARPAPAARCRMAAAVTCRASPPLAFQAVGGRVAVAAASLATA